MPEELSGALRYIVTDFLDTGWSIEEFEEELMDALDLVCYAYGEIQDIGEETPEEPGFLAQFQDLAWDELQDSATAYEGILDYASEIVYFISGFDAFSDTVAERMEEVADIAEDARTGAKFIPLVWSVKGVCDSGCQIHSRLEVDESVKQSTYVNFLKSIALVIVEVLLLATGVGAAYSFSYGSVGTINSILIHRIGPKIGWSAYSRLLSVAHWGVRIIYTKSFGAAIDGAVEGVSEEVVEASEEVSEEDVEVTPLSEAEADELAQSDIKKIAEESDWIGYTIWETREWIENWSIS
ncbi:hypothetical protein [Natrinema salsiterrestre]|uniref:Uncharacterized protein n=1 Tax=Natrinema salsiterrestre TaxID=2950540 RepID=A0A9Q4Q4W1_9EURY|nr:hypothetical protein [Natrinema salsiterrestre]MDF9747917.1 hypothetical protein [Natrinema salsiterrestre]